MIVNADMALTTRILKGSELRDALDGLAQLRIAVFAEYPYLYDGDPAYEKTYLHPYVDSNTAIVVGVYDGENLVGCATGMALEDHDEEFGEGLKVLNVPADQVFYCAESVLLPAWRGRGLGHVFFDEREAHAIALGRNYSAFCAVVREDNHPARPADYSPLDGFWQKRGYQKVDGAVSRLRWKDIGGEEESEHLLQFWIKELGK